MTSVFALMLATHCKKTEPCPELRSKLVDHVKTTFTQAEVNEADEDLATVLQWRAEVQLAASNATAAGVRENIVRYYKALTSIETRFPISKEKGHVNINFTWYDAFRNKIKASQMNIHFEKAAVLFNLAAVLNQSALNYDRTTPEGVQQACKLFQESAGVFAYLRDGEASRIDSPAPQDLSPDTLTAMEKLMLAQAQECVYLKAVLDKKAPTTVARLAKQTSILYSDVERCISGPSLSSHLDKGWLSHAQLKAAVFDVETLAQVGKGLHAEDKVHVEIAVLREALTRLAACKKAAKLMSQDMVDSVARIQADLTAAMNKAEKDNNSVFLQRVPSFADAGVNVQGALLVKAAVPALLEGGADGLFSSMIPDSAFKALSRYTDMQDSVIRKMKEQLACATDKARIRLKELELPDLLDALHPETNMSRYAGTALPEGLKAELDNIQAAGGLGQVNAMLSEIGLMRKEAASQLDAIRSALATDEQQDGAVRAEYGDKVHLVPSALAAKPYFEKLAQFESSLNTAGGVDQRVMDDLEANHQLFSNLNVEGIAGMMPRLQAPMVSPDDPLAITAGLRRDLQALEALASERSGMEEALKELKNSDNCLPKIMAANPTGHDALFAQELKKYDTLSSDIANNTKAQDAVLARLQEGAQAFSAAFDVVSWRKACAVKAAELKEDILKFKNLQEHCVQGFAFYTGITEAVKRVLREVQDFLCSRDLQRNDFRGDVVKSKRREEDEQLARRMAMADMMSNKIPAQGPPAGYPAAPPPPHHAQQQAPPPPPPQYAPAPQTPPPPPTQVAPPPPPQHQQQHQPPPPQQAPPPQQYSYGPPQHPPQQQYHQPPPQPQYQPQNVPYAPPPPQGGYSQAPPPAPYFAPPPGYAPQAPPPQQYYQQAPPPPYGHQQAPPQQYGYGAPPPPGVPSSVPGFSAAYQQHPGYR